MSVKEILNVLNLLFGIAGSIATIIVFYTSYTSVKERRPSVLFDPSPITIFDRDAQGAKDIDVKYKGKDISDRSVILKNIYFWNSGSVPVLQKDIYRQIRFIFENNSDILNSRIVKVSRDIVNPKIYIDENKPNYFSINFDVLEEQDGFAMQVIYAGPADAAIRSEGEFAEVKSGIRLVPALGDINSDTGFIDFKWQLLKTNIIHYRIMLADLFIVWVLCTVIGSIDCAQLARVIPRHCARRYSVYVGYVGKIILIIGQIALLIFVMSFASFLAYVPHGFKYNRLVAVPDSILLGK